MGEGAVLASAPNGSGKPAAPAMAPPMAEGAGDTPEAAAKRNAEGDGPLTMQNQAPTRPSRDSAAARAAAMAEGKAPEGPAPARGEAPRGAGLPPLRPDVVGGTVFAAEAGDGASATGTPGMAQRGQADPAARMALLSGAAVAEGAEPTATGSNARAAEAPLRTAPPVGEPTRAAVPNGAADAPREAALRQGVDPPQAEAVRDMPSPLPQGERVVAMRAALAPALAEAVLAGGFPLTASGAAASTATLVIFNAAMLPGWPPAFQLQGADAKAALQLAGADLAQMTPEEAAEYLAKMAAAYGFLLTVKKRLAQSLKDEKETILGLFSFFGVALDCLAKGLQMAFDLTTEQRALLAEVAEEMRGESRARSGRGRQRLHL